MQKVGKLFQIYKFIVSYTYTDRSRGQYNKRFFLGPKHKTIRETQTLDARICFFFFSFAGLSKQSYALVDREKKRKFEIILMEKIM